jgi:signal transduction histidine kinase
LNNGGRNLLESSKTLEEALDILRDISKSINPDHINRIGLAQAFRNELNRIQKTKVFRTTFELKGTEFSVSPQHQIILFRIVQESLNNILKHSGGDLVSMTASFEEPFIEVTILDNGKGFDTKLNQSQGKGSGLQNMTKRASFINASLTINSSLNQGTRVHLLYPERGKNSIP